MRIGQKGHKNVTKGAAKGEGGGGGLPLSRQYSKAPMPRRGWEMVEMVVVVTACYM